jgi:hypothetical protein
MTTDVATATMEEALAAPEGEATLRRLYDWRHRVHTLYDNVRAHLDAPYTCDRSGKQRSLEGRIQQAGVADDDVPQIDILRIERDGRIVAQFTPRMLWMFGANGRVDLLVTSQGAGRLFILFDRSAPLSNRGDWRLVRPIDMMAQPPFHPVQFHETLECAVRSRWTSCMARIGGHRAGSTGFLKMAMILLSRT